MSAPFGEQRLDGVERVGAGGIRPEASVHRHWCPVPRGGTPRWRAAGWPCASGRRHAGAAPARPEPRRGRLRPAARRLARPPNCDRRGCPSTRARDLFGLSLPRRRPAGPGSTSWDRWLSRDTRCRRVGAGFERALTSAPWSSSNVTAAACPWSAAHISAVVPRRLSFALTCAPRSSNTFIAATLPVRDAIISARLAPRQRLVRIRARLQQALDDGRRSPFSQASDSGVAPSRLATFDVGPGLNATGRSWPGPHGRPPSAARSRRRPASRSRRLSAPATRARPRHRRASPRRPRRSSAAPRPAIDEQQPQRTTSNETISSASSRRLPKHRRIRRIRGTRQCNRILKDPVYSSQRLEFLEPARAVPDVLFVNVEPVQHAQQQVARRNLSWSDTPGGVRP